jgi:nicotinamidase-related amidase
MEPFLAAARRNKLLIIHAPSDTMAFYADAPQRKAILAFGKRATPTPLEITDPPLPIDDSDGGCDTSGDKFYKAWKRQHPGLTIAPNDLISDNGQEVYAALQARGITHLLVAGVHTNMCILNRSFAIRQMTKWGLKCILIRDLTDAMYDPADRPFVSHDAGTQLVIEHIERHWAPTVTSTELLKAWSR